MGAVGHKAKNNRKKYIKRWREKNRDRVNASARKRYTTDGRWEKQLRDRFNWTPEQYWQQYEKQHGLCKICGKSQSVGKKLDVDHDHKTGKNRALLCRNCNTGLGQFHDDSDLLYKAYLYVEGIEFV